MRKRQRAAALQNAGMRRTWRSLWSAGKQNNRLGCALARRAFCRFFVRRHKNRCVSLRRFALPDAKAAEGCRAPKRWHAPDVAKPLECGKTEQQIGMCACAPRLLPLFRPPSQKPLRIAKKIRTARCESGRGLPRSKTLACAGRGEAFGVRENRTTDWDVRLRAAPSAAFSSAVTKTA